MKKMAKKVIRHLKGDIKGYRHEIEEDKELIKTLKKKKASPKKKPSSKKRVVRRKKK